MPTDSLEEATERSSSAQDSMSSGETLLRRTQMHSGEHLPPMVEGRYQVDEEDAAALLGKGGQGTVWRAYDKLLRREVALKKLHSSPEPDDVTAFLREARLTALLEHPGIVPLHDVGTTLDGSLYLALRRIEGKSLADTLAAAKGLDDRLVLVPALVRACQAVAFAHERGVVHRDLKPQNIMLGRFGETYVLDWGLALVESREGAPDVTAPRQAAGVVGTPAYMSPEQALGLAADAKSDVWGLGACLYQLLTGQPPITGRSLASAMGHASAGEISPVLAVEPSAPRDLAAICAKALSIQRSERYADASALAADLEAWLAGRTVSARSYSRGQLLRRALMANRREVALMLAALLALGGVLGFDELRIRRERNEARTFARELIRELPTQVDASRSNVELINTITTRAQQWLGRSDLSTAELEEACEVLGQLGAINSEISSWAPARELYGRAQEVAARGRALQPVNPSFLACEAGAKGGLGWVEVASGNAEAGMRLLEQGWQMLDAWPGAPSIELSLARGELGNRWGIWEWEHGNISRARQLYVAAAEAVLPLIDSTDVKTRRSALGRGANAVTSIWAEGRRDEAVALARRFYEAAAIDCAELTLSGQRACLTPASSYASISAWVRAPDAALASAKVLEVDEFIHQHDADSAAYLYDSINLLFEHDRYALAATRARELRLGESAAWGMEVAPLAAVFAGALDEVDAWGPLLGESQTGGPLALGLREAAAGHYAEAARRLRTVKSARLWFDLTWPASPKPALKLPPAAQPAFERFLADFTRSYGAIDHEGLSAAVDALAGEFEKL